MTVDFQKLRLDGVYRMNDQDELMLRVKQAGGVLSADQAEAVAELADRYAGGRLHATCRGSFELHRLRLEQIEPIKAALAVAGLTSRGACGGAVRGVSCSASLLPDAENAQRLAAELQRHFIADPAFEGLPKKFKIGIDTGYAGGRYLIQDVGLVHAGADTWDVWAGGGLGREPQAALPLARAVPEVRLRALLEAVIAVYGTHAPTGKRLKHVINTLGADAFRAEVQAQLNFPLGKLPVVSATAVPQAAGLTPVEFRFFGGELTSAELRRLAALARRYAGGQLRVTAEQSLALPPADAAAQQALLQAAGDADKGPRACRLCPGSHDCRMGLAPTRELARRLLAELGPAAAGLSLAISGCPNSCSQPQLADFGIVTSKRLKEGESPWRFTLYRRASAGLGEIVARDLSWQEITEHLRRLTNANSRPN